jgi:hypothetical protein
MLSRREIDQAIAYIETYGETTPAIARMAPRYELAKTAKQLGDWLGEALRACDACGGWNQEEAVNRVARKWAGQP